MNNNQFTQEELENEIWKDIPGYEGLYQASSLGRIKSLEKRARGTNNTYRRIKESIMIGNIDPYRYSRVILSKGEKQKQYRVHILVLLTFIGERPKELQSCHNDGNSLNNRLENLRYDTPENNTRDKYIHNTMLFGEDNPQAKLKEQDIVDIFNLYKTSNITHKEIAKKYGVDKTTVAAIFRKNWRHTREKYNLSDAGCHKKIVGENHKSHKLTAKQVLEIRALYTTGEYTLSTIAKQFK